MVLGLLNNTKAFEQMEGQGNKRIEKTRQRRMNADDDNIVRGSEKKSTHKKERDIQISTANDIPFYERL